MNRSDAPPAYLIFSGLLTLAMRAFNVVPLAVVAITVLVAKSGLFTADVTTAGLGFLLLMLCLWPALAWVAGGMRHLPLFEIYCFMHLTYYWVPAGKVDGEILSLSEVPRAVVLGALSLYLLCGQAVYFGLLRHLRQGQTQHWRFWSNHVPLMTGVRLPWLLLMVWLAYAYGFQSGLIWDYIPGTLITFVRSLATVMGLLGVFVLGLRAGRGDFSRFHVGLFAFAVLVGALLSFATGFLVLGTIFAGNAFFAYTIGSRKLPMVTLGLFLALVSLLNYGKGEMRLRYWALGESTGLVEMYSHWFASSWEEFKLPADRRGATAISAFDRANLTQVCAAVVTQSPHPIPYLHGQTYVDSLALLVPRIIWPDRPDLHAFMGELALRYGIHANYESTQHTVITMGQIGEAWANGGWLAVGLVGAFFGGLFHLGVRIAYGRGHDTVGFLLGMTFAGFTVGLEALAGTLLMTLYQTVVVSLALLYLMSRPATPERVRSRRSEKPRQPEAGHDPAPVVASVSSRASHP